MVATAEKHNNYLHLTCSQGSSTQASFFNYWLFCRQNSAAWIVLSYCRRPVGLKELFSSPCLEKLKIVAQVVST